MTLPAAPATRIFGVMARAAPRVVLIRRGPSKRVLLLAWDTARHEFLMGQWFKGRIYEERCDLSPSGEQLIYLAANQKGPLYSWTAVSRPPYLTALTLWPNMGTWGGGGLFESERVILLNSLYTGLKPAPGFRLPKDIRVAPIAPWAGRGEDEPMQSMRMKRDDWVLADEGTVREYRLSKPFAWQFVVPRRWRKARNRLVLERRLMGIGESNGAWHVHEHELFDEAGASVLDLGRSDWADWSHSGELLFTREGRVYRVVLSLQGAPGEPEELIDLRPLTFEQVPPPREALEWKSRVKGRRIR
jgi:hypothetical protein